MPIPTKVPIEYAVQALNQDSRGFSNPARIGYEELLNEESQYMVRVTKLRPHFASNRYYQQFRANIQVHRGYWEGIIQNDPSHKKYAQRQMRVNPTSGAASATTSRRNSRRNSPVRSRSTSPTRRKTPRYGKNQLVMASKLGDDFTRDELLAAKRSLISIQKSGDECDDMDVNLPLPACKAINKICRRYNNYRQYIPYKPDGSEQSDYQLRVLYHDPNAIRQ